MRYPIVGLFGKPDHEGTAVSIRTLLDYLSNKGCTVLVEQNVANSLDLSSLNTASLEQIGHRAHLAIVVGGDGSMLSAARVLAKHQIHVVGVNRGNLGFLTDISPDDIEPQLDRLFDGHWRVEERFLLEVCIERNGVIVHRNTALNEVVLHHGKVAHMMEFDIFLNAQFVSSQRADGMIVATPTGSTAYSLSGGGPILMPNMNAITLVPMFPHTLTSRPIVVDASSKISMRVSARNSDSLQVNCDSHIELSAHPGDIIHVKQSPDKLLMVHSALYDYFAVLRNKLNWGSTPV